MVKDLKFCSIKVKSMTRLHTPFDTEAQMATDEGQVDCNGQTAYIACSPGVIKKTEKQSRAHATQIWADEALTAGLQNLNSYPLLSVLNWHF